jgi:hypothetical protein
MGDWLSHEVTVVDGLYSRAAISDHVHDWLQLEEARYADGKWTLEEMKRRVALGDPATGRLPGVGMGSESMDGVQMYMHRAQVLGLENPLGRQALAKALMTLFSRVEGAVALYGPLPAAGVPSGVIQ